MGTGRPDINLYHDYRAYLGDCFAWMAKSRKFSLRSLARSVGVSHGYFSLILSGQRNLSEKVIPDLARELGLDAAERESLRHLVVLADSPKAEARNRAFAELKRSPGFKDRHPREFETYKYLENWLHVVIRELALTRGFQADAGWIRKQLTASVPLKDIQESLDFLFAGGFLERMPDGEVRPTARNVSCVGGVFQLSLGNFHTAMLDLAKSAIAKFRKIQRKQIGYTVALAQDDFDAVKEILEEAKEKIKALEKRRRGRPSDTVYHVNFSAFPVAGKGGADDES